MIINRTHPDVTNTNVLAMQLSDLHGPCVGCQGCKGLCTALIDALLVPDLVLSRKRETQ